MVDYQCYCQEIIAKRELYVPYTISSLMVIETRNVPTRYTVIQYRHSHRNNFSWFTRVRRQIRGQLENRCYICTRTHPQALGNMFRNYRHAFSLDIMVQILFRHVRELAYNKASHKSSISTVPVILPLPPVRFFTLDNVVSCIKCDSSEFYQYHPKSFENFVMNNEYELISIE